MKKISAKEVKKLPEGTKVLVFKDGIRGWLEYELKGGSRPRLLRLPDKESYLPIKDRQGWRYYVEREETK